jgi:N-acyl-D-amino-acid deacylase
MMRRYLSGLNGEPDIAWDWGSVKEYLARFDGQTAINIAYLVPHNALRLETMGFVDRTPIAEELRRMQELLAQGMREGAAGFSTGLDYYPCRYADEEELAKLSEVVARYKGISVWHIRKNDLGLVTSTEEVIRIAEKTGVKAHFSHFSVSGADNHGQSKELLAMVDRARENGLDVTFDAYPYIAQSTMLLALLPRWVFDGGPEAILNRLGQPKVKDEICAQIRAMSPPWDKIVLTCVPSEKNRVYVGQTLLEAAGLADKDAAELVADLLLEEQLAVGHLSLLGYEDELQRIMQHPCHTSGSDGILIGDKPNPRAWGTFPRFLGVYARQLGVLRLEQIVRHMTAAPAQCLGLNDRGLIKEGLAADLVVFNPQTVIDNATFAEPKKYPTGIDYVLVNGAVVVDEGKHTGAFNGRALRKRI